MNRNEDTGFEEAERALSGSGSETPRNVKKNKRKIPSSFILAGLVLVLLIVITAQLLSSSEQPQIAVIPPEVSQQIEGQLNMYSDILNSYRNSNGRLPETEEEFLGVDDPVITYRRLSANSYRLEYFFLDSTIVKEETLPPIETG
ncbi:MAG: hypothetical protein GF388_03360, partial [Candidatus Aegiribacteria sp.]|nr:hypothetical protein [Candidatus Aegiribacteria sp.]